MTPHHRNRLIARFVLLAIIGVFAFLKQEFNVPRNDEPGPADNQKGNIAESTQNPAELPAERPNYEIIRSKKTSESPKSSSRDNSPPDNAPQAENQNGPTAETYATESARPSSPQSLPPGQLTEIRKNVFRSTAGLTYVPSQTDGHRVRHVMMHAKDDPSKKIHGVFDGDQEQILAVIDDAFLKSQEFPADRDVRIEKQNQRRVITVRMNRRIGYVGGQDGKRQRYPECRFLRLVLESDDVVVTAYPTKSF
jgi:hypothetical protein